MAGVGVWGQPVSIIYVAVCAAQNNQLICLPRLTSYKASCGGSMLDARSSMAEASFLHPVGLLPLLHPSFLHPSPSSSSFRLPLSTTEHAMTIPSRVVIRPLHSVVQQRQLQSGLAMLNPQAALTALLSSANGTHLGISLQNVD